MSIKLCRLSIKRNNRHTHYVIEAPEQEVYHNDKYNNAYINHNSGVHHLIDSTITVDIDIGHSQTF